MPWLPWKRRGVSQASKARGLPQDTVPSYSAGNHANQCLRYVPWHSTCCVSDADKEVQEFYRRIRSEEGGGGGRRKEGRGGYRDRDRVSLSSEVDIDSDIDTCISPSFQSSAASTVDTRR